MCRRDFYGAPGMLHVSGALFSLVHGDRFVNPGANPACPEVRLSFWMTRQDGGDLGETIAATEGRIAALDRANVRDDEVTTATQVKLAVVASPRTTAEEMRTLAFAAHSLLGYQCPLVEAFLPLLDWINSNRVE